jgi:translation initiation factor IF-3
MDFGKYKYEQAKKQHGARQHQKGIHIKEIKLRPRTGPHDLEIKVRNARRFLEEKNKVKVTLTFRGREMAYLRIGSEVMAKFTDMIKDIGQVEHPAKMEGRSMVLILMPKPELQKAPKGEPKVEQRGETGGKAETQDAPGSGQAV